MARLLNAEDGLLPTEHRLTELAAMGAELDALFVNPACAPGLTSEQRSTWAARFLQRATNLLQEELLPDLCRRGVCAVPVEDLGAAQQAWLHDYFRRNVYPLLTPLAVDPGHPFPYISSDSLNLLVELRGSASERGGKLFARVKVPRLPARLIEVPASGDDKLCPQDGSGRIYVWSADMVRHFIHDLFPQMPVQKVHIFRVLRAERESCEDLKNGMGTNGTGRNGIGLDGWRYGSGSSPMRDGVARRREETPAVRLDVEQSMPMPVSEWLMQRLGLPSHDVFRHRCTPEMVCLPYLVEKATAQNGTRIPFVTRGLD